MNRGNRYVDEDEEHEEDDGPFDEEEEEEEDFEGDEEEFEDEGGDEEFDDNYRQNGRGNFPAAAAAAGRGRGQLRDDDDFDDGENDLGDDGNSVDQPPTASEPDAGYPNTSVVGFEGPTPQGSMAHRMGGSGQVPNESLGRSFASGLDSLASGEQHKKKPRDRSDDYRPHRFSDKLEAVTLPEKMAKILFPQGNLEAQFSAHRNCFCFYGFAMRRTTHIVKKERKLLVVMTYESIVLVDTDKGELLRIIPVLQIMSPVYCVLEERLLHLKVEGEHDVILQFIGDTEPSVSHPIDILCDRICDLYFQLRVEDLTPDETPDMIERLEVAEIPTSKQLVDVDIRRPPHVSYPAVRMKELLRYENPPSEEVEVSVPPEARAQIPETLAEIPDRDETFVTTLNKARIEDLSKELALLSSHRSDILREHETLLQGNDMLRDEYQSLNLSVQSLRTAVQLAYKDAEQAQGGSRRKKTRRVVRRVAAAPQQMKWEKGSDEPDLDEEMQDGFDDDANNGNQQFEEYDEEVEEEEGGDEEGEDWDEYGGEGTRRHSRHAQEQQALNNTIKHEMRILTQKLKLVKVKLMQAQEQASRLWTRTDRATELIAVYQDVLLRLEFIAQEAAVRESGASQSKPALEKENRDLRMELKALKLLDQVSDERDAELVKAETDVALKKKVLQNKMADEDKALEDAIRPQRIEYERHMAEVTAFFEAESEKAAARAAVEFHQMHTKARTMVTKSQDLSVKERVDASITQKVSTQLSETKYLRLELQKRANFVAGALVSLRDENEGIKRMLNDLMKEHATSLEAHLELRTRLLDTQRSLAEERSLRKDILERTKDQIVARTQELLRKKEDEITRTRRLLFEMQDSLQRAANTFGLGAGGAADRSSAHRYR